MSAAFTSGPWLIEPQGKGARGHWFQRESDGEYLAMSCKLKDQAEEDANANLIAAAPGLYDALEIATRTIDTIVETLADHGFGYSENATSVAAMGRAILAKARGEQSL